MNIRSYFASTIFPAVFGLVLGELLMTRMFLLFQPVLGAMTFLTVEVVGAFLIDFPMACLSAFLFGREHPQAGTRDGVFTGACAGYLFIRQVL